MEEEKEVIKKNLENLEYDVLWLIIKETIGAEGDWNIVQIMSLRLTCRSFYDIVTDMKIPEYAKFPSQLPELGQPTRPWWTFRNLLRRVARADCLPSFLMTRVYMYNMNSKATFRDQLISNGSVNELNAETAMTAAINGGHEHLALDVLGMDFRLTHDRIRNLHAITKDCSSRQWQTYLRSYCQCILCKATGFDGTLILNVAVEGRNVVVSPPVTGRVVGNYEIYICDERLHNLAFHVKSIQIRFRKTETPMIVILCHNCSLKQDAIYTIPTTTLSVDQQLEFDRIIRERMEHEEAKHHFKERQAAEEYEAQQKRNEKELNDAWKHKLASVGTSIVSGYADNLRPTQDTSTLFQAVVAIKRK
jgi:hypothetical protein